MKYNSLQHKANQDIANTINKLNAANGIDSKISARDVAAVAAAYAITPTVPSTASSTTVKENAIPAKKTYSLQPLGLKILNRAKEEPKEEVKKNTAEDDKSKWYQGYFKKGDALEDGFSLGDVAKAYLGTLSDIAVNLPAGVIGWGENIVDFGATLLGGAADKFGAEGFRDKMTDFVKKDLYDEKKVTKAILKHSGVSTNPILSALGTIVKVEDMINKEGSDNSVLDDKADSFVQSAGEAVAKIGISAAVPGVPVADIITGVTTFGQQSEVALNEGANVGEAIGSALVSAGAEVLMEKLFGFTYSGKALTANFKKRLAEKVAKTGLRSFLSLVGDFVGEGFEEVATEFVSKLGTALYKEENWRDIVSSDEALQDYIDSFIQGSILGGTFSSAKAAGNVISGTQAAKDGSANSILEKAKQIAEAESKNDTGYESFKNIKSAYEQLSQSLEKTNGEISTIKQKSLLGQLKQETVRAQLMPYIERSAEKIVQNAELVAQKYSEYGLKDANGKPISVTAKDILSGIDINADRKTYIKQLRKALTTNSVLSTLAVVDATGNITMDTAKFAEATLKAKNLADHADLEYFVEHATDAEKSTVGKALGIQDWNTVSVDQFRNKVAAFAESGKLYEYATKTKQSEQNTVKTLDNDSGIRYAKGKKLQKFSFQHKNFPQENEVQSEAHRLAVWWSYNKARETGDQTLISMNGKWYLVEKFDDATSGYQVEDIITQSEYQQISKEIKENGRSGKILSIQERAYRNGEFYQLGNSVERGTSSSNSMEAEHGGENSKVLQVDNGKSTGRETESNGRRNSESGSKGSQRVNAEKNSKKTLAQYRTKTASTGAINPEKNANLGAEAQNISQNVAKPLDNEAGVRYAKSSGSKKRNSRTKKYISPLKIGVENTEYLKRQLFKLYSGLDNCIGNGIAIEKDDTIYIVDSSKHNNKMDGHVAVRETLTISDNKLRAEEIRRINNDAISNGYVSDELSSRLGLERDNSSKSSSGFEVGEKLSADKGQSQNNEGRVSSDNGNRGVQVLTSDKKALSSDENSRTDEGKTTEAKSMTVIESAAFAKENVPEYKELNADDQARVRRLIRQAKANGFTDKQTRAYARVAARSNIDIVIDKESLHLGNGKYADGLYSPKRNKIFVNPEGSRSPARLLIHELTHAIYNDGKGRLILERGAKDLSDEEKKRIIKAYFGNGEIKINEDGEIENIEEITLEYNDELNAHYTEALLDDDALLEKLCNDNPTLKDKILSFFKKAITGYSDEPNLSREAKKLYKRYKTLFDSFSVRNQYNTASSINNENMHDTEGKESTNIRFAKPIDSYPYDMQTVIKEYLDATDSKLEYFIDDALSETNEKRLEYMHYNFVNDIPNNILNDIKKLVGFDVSKFGIKINGESIHHINRMHGEQGKHDHSMQNKKDIARIQYIVSNADKVEYTINSSNVIAKDHQYRNSDNSASNLISITKKINGTYYVICAVPDSKLQTMHIKSAYISKKEVTQEFDATNAPNATSKTNLEITSKDSISQNSKKSTENPKKVSTNSGDRYALPDTESDTDFDISTKLSEGIPRKTGKSSLTVGELRKVIANNTKQKVYSKQDALSVVGRFTGISNLTQKARTDMADAVWQILNESPDVQYRHDVAHDMAEFIVAKMITDSKTKNPDAIEAQERLDYLRTGIGRISFSEGDMSDIRHVLDQKGLKQVLGRWGYKGKQDTRRIPMDVFVCDIARQMPSMEYLEDMNPVDAFLEIDALYRGAKAEAKDKWISTYWDMPDSEIPNMIKSIEDEIMRAYETEGSQSKFSKMVENKISYYSERAEFWKAEYDKLSGRNRLLGLLMSKAQKMKELKLGTFANSTQYDSDIFKSSIEKLARIQYRGNLNVAGTREIISNLHKWYTSNDVKTGILGYVDDKNTGLYVQGVSDMLEALANGTLKKQSVFQEISDVVNKALSNTGKINEKYNQKQISKVPSKIANLVSKASEGKIDLSRKHIALNGDHIWHEYRNHSNIAKEIGKKQLPFSPQSMEEAISAIYDPDMIETVFADANNPTQRQSFAYVKKSADGHYIVVEAVGGKDNPNIVPVMILQFSESKWNDMMSSGKTLGEMFFENDKKKLDSLDIEFNKKNRVIVAQFASTEAIANTPHSPQFNNSISQSNQDVNIKADDLEKGFSKQELKMLYDVMSYFTNFVENWGKVYRRGRWIEAKPEAERYINTIHSNEDLKVGLFSKLAGTTYMQTFGDPMTVARRMDRYESGFYTEMLSELRDAAVDAQVAEMEMRTAYDEFMAKNKKYVENASAEKVTYRGVQIPKMHLIGLYMTMKRNHSWAGITLNGFTFTDIDSKRVRVNGITSPDTKLSEAELKKLIKEQATAIDSLLTKTDKEYIAILEQAYNVDARNAKADRDKQRLGFTNATNDYYYPIRRGNISKNIDTNIMSEIDRVSNSSFNKDTVRGAKQELYIEPADVVFNRHIHAVCQYAYLSPAIEAYNVLYNMDISGNPNKPISVATESANTWNKGNKYFAKLISDIQGIPASSDEGMKALGFIRGSYAKFQLGANPKVWLTQLSSVFASSSMLDADSIARGMSISSKDIDEYCSLAKLRNYDNTAAMAQAVLDSKTKRTISKIGKFSDLLMSPIGKMDRFTVGRLFGACQAQVEKNGGAKVGTDANKIEAGKLLRRVILETQQNSIATERSAAMRSGNEIMRTLTMFTSDSMKVIGRVIDSIGEASTLRARLRTSTDADSKAKFQQQLKEANRKMRKSVGALCLTAVFMASIAQLFRWLYDKEQDEDESVAETMLVDAVGNLFGGLPLFKDAYAKIFEGYDVDNYAYSAINDLLDSALNLFSVAENLLTNEGSAQERNLAIRKLSYSVGQILGIPTRNVYNMFYGLTKRFNPETAYVIDNAFYKKNYQNDLYKAIERDDAEMSSFIMSLLLGERMNENIAKSVFNELLTLSKNGQKVLPKTIPSSITIKGTEYQLSETEQAAVKNIYITAEKSLKALFAKANYKKLSDEQKAEAIDFVYDTYYDKALANTLGIDRGNNHLIAEVVGADLLALLNIATKGLTSDTDKRGNVISGSKKKKVVAAVNALGVSREQKLLLIASKGYSLTDSEKKRLLRYILNLKATKSQKEELAELCGFTVKNGKIITKNN